MQTTFFTNTMEKSKSPDNFDFKTKILNENMNSRRFSASNLRSNPTISSTIIEPQSRNHFLKTIYADEINPSTYSFTTALKALQAKTVYLSPEHGGFSLNSKWSDAEKYICNPLSGRVPLECLSSKTLSGRSVGVAMSPVVYRFPAKPKITDIATLAEDKKTGDGGTRSELSSIRGPSTPSTGERSVAGDGDSSVWSEEVKSEVKVKETGEKLMNVKKRNGWKVGKMMTSCRRGGGCLALRNFVRRHGTKKNKTVDNPTSPAAFVCHVNASFRK